MNVKDYEYIVAIAEQESISQAANRLYITQSALTRYLQRIEAGLHISLFYRQGNRFLLTNAGKQYVKKAREILKLDCEIDFEMKTLALNNRKRIRFGCGVGRLAQIVDYILPAFCKLHSDFRISLHTDGSAALSHMLEMDQLDLALLSAIPKSPNLSYVSIGNIHIALAVPCSSKLIDEAVQEPGYPYPVLKSTSWIEEPYIRLGPASSSGRIAEKYFQNEKIDPKIVLDVEHSDTALKAVENGIGNNIAFTVPLCGRAFTYLCLPKLSVETGNINIAKRNDYNMNSSAEDLIHIIVENFS